MKKIIYNEGERNEVMIMLRCFKYEHAYEHGYLYEHEHAYAGIINSNFIIAAAFNASVNDKDFNYAE